MSIETQDDPLIYEIALDEGSLTASVITSYESLLDASAVPLGDGSIELDVGGGVVVRVRVVASVGRTLATRNKHLKSILVANESWENVSGRILSAGASVLGWFSLRRAWTLDSHPDADADELIVRDRMGVAWLFRLVGDDYSSCRSQLPVSDVKAALVWYPHLFDALGWGDGARQIDHGACVDLVTDRWDARLFPKTAWSLEAAGIARPKGWNGCTGEVSYDDANSFEDTRRRLESLGLRTRTSQTFLAATDPFGHEWYVGLNTVR